MKINVKILIVFFLLIFLAFSIALYAKSSQSNMKQKEINLGTYIEGIGNMISHESFIQALKDAEDKGISEIIIPFNSVILISKTVTIPSEISISANRGKVYVQLSKDFTGGNCFFIKGSNVHISDLIIDCSLIDRDSFHAFKIDPDGQLIQNISIKNCEVFKNIKKNDYAVWIKGDEKEVLVKDVEISNCTFHNYYYGIRTTDNAENIKISNSVFYSIANMAIDFQGSGEKKSYTRSIIISNNFMSDIGGTGFAGHPIRLSTGGGIRHKNILISNNTLIGNSLPFQDGGNADMIGAYDCSIGVIESNYVAYGGDVGICLWRSDGLLVSKNSVENNNGKGIAVFSSQRCTIETNFIMNNNIYSHLTNINKFETGEISVAQYKPDEPLSTNNTITDNQIVTTLKNDKIIRYNILIKDNSPSNKISRNVLENINDSMIKVDDKSTILDQ
ncbi:MAG: right-handed parallel beta-helix repeat-containing protein [Candidatus Cloacimonetes bacterium]|nr:right-handed parallel beta-helix repeat-containing protein [Candidatus Cloacimonadota bacterium]